MLGIKKLTSAFNACVKYVGLRRRDEVDLYDARMLGCKIIDYLKYRLRLLGISLLHTSLKNLFLGLYLSFRLGHIIHYCFMFIRPYSMEDNLSR